MRIDVVIGNAFGDEGKGLVTDWLSSPDTTVVRFSGGAQAGHTVVDPSGLRHVFHHIGSGTLRGAATFLARDFACDPFLFVRERAELIAKGITPTVAVDPLAPVGTPFDVLLNQLTEKARGGARHGSCGCGIGEAMRRHEDRPERLVVADLDSPLLRAKLDAIEDATAIEIARRGLDAPDGYAERCIALLTDAIPAFLGSVRVIRQADLYAPHLVYEGSQGLLLDRDIGAFPHVTRAKTGLATIPPGHVRDASIYFVSRCYLTRHGAGPLPGEGPPPVPAVDTTNVENPWQAALRFAPYDPRLLEWARRRALAEVDRAGRVLTVTTCLDQIEGEIVVAGGERVGADFFVRTSDVVSRGPTRNDIHGTPVRP